MAILLKQLLKVVSNTHDPNPFSTNIITKLEHILLQEYLEMQRQLALQRLQEQEREMQMRLEQQKHMTQIRQMQNYGYPQVSNFYIDSILQL
jgi:isoleucyl-tRNA synthetase